MLQEILRQRRLIVTVFMVVWTVLVVRVYRSPQFETTAVIMIDSKVSPSSLDSRLMYSDQTERLVRTDMELIRSAPVLRKVVTEVGIVGSGAGEKAIAAVAGGLSDHIVLTSNVFTNVIDISVTYDSPETAAKVANSVAENYIRWQIEFKQEEAGRLLESLDQELTLLRTELMAVEGRTAKTSIEDTLRAREAQTIEERYLFLAQERERAELARTSTTTGDVAIISRAPVPSGQTGRRTRVLSASMVALFCSFGLGVAVAAKSELSLVLWGGG